MNDKFIISSTRRWLESVVIELNLCPFAKVELVRERINFVISAATTEAQLLLDLEKQLLILHKNEKLTTTLLIVPYVLQNFYSFNQFLDIAEDLLVEIKLEGVFQIASFHPNYQFVDTNPEDLENFTNKSPYPILHLLSEDHMGKVLAKYPNAEEIPERNIQLLESLGRHKLNAIFYKI